MAFRVPPGEEQKAAVRGKADALKRARLRSKDADVAARTNFAGPQPQTTRLAQDVDEIAAIGRDADVGDIAAVGHLADLHVPFRSRGCARLAMTKPPSEGQK